VSCWNTIGVWGSELPRCPRLEQVVHCRNCDVFATAGREVLERAHSSETLRENARRLAEPSPEREALSDSWMVFRLGEEWLALPTRCFEEVIANRPIHSIPHRSGGVVLGLANYRGRLELCCSLQRLLGVAADQDDGCIVVLTTPSGRLVLAPVAKVLGMRRYPQDVISHKALAYLSGIVDLDGRRVGLIDPTLLFEALERNFRR
jgi:chemotaxis-related protein WspD